MVLWEALRQACVEQCGFDIDTRRPPKSFPAHCFAGMRCTGVSDEALYPTRHRESTRTLKQIHAEHQKPASYRVAFEELGRRWADASGDVDMPICAEIIWRYEPTPVFERTKGRRSCRRQDRSPKPPA